MVRDDFREIADSVARDIDTGRIAAGDRLPPQREFAYRRGIAVSTAARVYSELTRRGLVAGEVGRGTFVRAAARAAPTRAGEPPAEGRIDLELNFPVLAEQSAMLGKAFAGLAQPDRLEQSLRTLGVFGTAAGRDAVARYLAVGRWQPSPSQVVFVGNGRQAIAAAVSAVAPAGERMGVESLTYPILKGIAARLGVVLVPLAMDEDGIRPEALAAACRAHRLSAIYVQPTLQNPLGTSMPAARRAELAQLVRQLDIQVIEDRVYSFLVDEEPLAAMLAERTILVDSMSKRLAPGLTLGFAIAAPGLLDAMAAAIRAGGLSAHGFAFAACQGWIEDGTAAEIVAAKRVDARVRQQLAREHLSELTLRGDPRAYHVWAELPEAWRAELFVAAAARRGIAVTPGSAFAVASGHAPNAVRLALASPSLQALAGALSTLRGLVRAGPDAASLD